MRVLLTGGAGYIGSHVARCLKGQGHEVIIYDNLSTGSLLVERYAHLVVGDILDGARLDEAFAAYHPDVVMHFAAKIVVPESVEKPLLYYENNVAGSLSLLQAVARHGVDKFVFSSSAAVYGIPGTAVVTEDTPLMPINPYGTSKMMVEMMLSDLAASGKVRFVALRYFNVAGADPSGELGDTKEDASHLITVSVRTAAGERPFLQVFGDDYPTPDGTCVRDYIHVSDLAQAHADVMDYLTSGGGSAIFNCGYGLGFSVNEVVAAVKKVTAVDFPVKMAPRRAGDPPSLVADASRLRQSVGWKPRYNDLELIIRTVWEWEKVRPR
jgi:UDP-glucose 4-epimerase